MRVRVDFLASPDGQITVTRIGWRRWRVKINAGEGAAPVSWTFWGGYPRALEVLEERLQQIDLIEQEAKRDRRARRVVVKQHREGRHLGAYKDCPRCADSRRKYRI